MTAEDRVEVLERVLAEYVAKYGLTDEARKYWTCHAFVPTGQVLS